VIGSLISAAAMLIDIGAGALRAKGATLGL
jgi:hypothetical protein